MTLKNPMDEFISFANILADESAKVVMEYFRQTFTIENKDDDTPVTIADKKSELKIRELINKAYPNHGILAEEFDNTNLNSEYIWVIDPIDGTRSYIIGNPTWSNLISLNYKGYPVLSLANFPKLHKYYLNYNDRIAYVFEKGKKRRLLVNKKIPFSKAKVAGAFHGWLSIKKQLKIPKVLRLMRFKCVDSLSYAHLAEGRIDIVIQCANKIWDIHPIIPIVKAAGGIISTWDNRDAINAGNVLVSSNKIIHNRFLKLLKPVSK